MPVFDFIKDQRNKDDDGRTYESIPVSKILPNPNQPRRTFDDESLGELAASIEQVGVIQPLLVRKVADGYELVAGERRLRAAKSIGLTKVPCIVQETLLEEASTLIALIENLQRENLHFLEEAESYSAIMDNYGMTQEELAERLGKSQPSIANKLRILRLSPSVKSAMTDGGLSERHARALLKIRDENTQLQIIKKVQEKSLSVKETETLVEKTLNKLYDEKQGGEKPRPMIIRMIKDYRIFMNTINSAINTLRDSGVDVEVEQFDRQDGVDISIKVTRR